MSHDVILPGDDVSNEYALNSVRLDHDVGTLGVLVSGHFDFVG